jgi:hypothetical protein
LVARLGQQPGSRAEVETPGVVCQGGNNTLGQTPNESAFHQNTTTNGLMEGLDSRVPCSDKGKTVLASGHTDSASDKTSGRSPCRVF